MDEIKKEQIKNTVYKFAELAKITDRQACDDLVQRLSTFDIDDAIDTILVSLNSLANRKVLTQEDVFSNVDLILQLNPDKYKNAGDLVARLNWIKSMNMEYPQMPLSENHKLVIETFDKFNGLVGTDLDSYYTGGLMGYLATGHELERYHGDLDLFINEEQLDTLKTLVDSSEEFEFVSNLDNKEVNGHEYKITYKGTPMSIGLFLFSREENGEVVIKGYYYPNKDKKEGLHVDEHHLSQEYASMMFSEEIREHNGAHYRMQSLESIYNAKKNSRPKDRYDASIIKDSVDLEIDYRLDTEKGNNYDINNKYVINSPVHIMEKRLSPKKEDVSIS